MKFTKKANRFRAFFLGCLLLGYCQNSFADYFTFTLTQPLPPTVHTTDTGIQAQYTLSYSTGGAKGYYRILDSTAAPMKINLTDSTCIVGNTFIEVPSQFSCILTVDFLPALLPSGSFSATPNFILSTSTASKYPIPSVSTTIVSNSPVSSIT